MHLYCILILVTFDPSEVTLIEDMIHVLCFLWFYYPPNLEILFAFSTDQDHQIFKIKQRINVNFATRVNAGSSQSRPLSFFTGQSQLKKFVTFRPN